MRNSKIIPDLVCGVAIALVVAAVFILFHQEIIFKNIPIHYDGDSYCNLAGIKTAAEGGVAPFQFLVLKRMNAPLAAEWSD